MKVFGTRRSAIGVLRFYLTQSVSPVLSQKSNPPQNPQLILHFKKYKESFDGFVWELTFAKRLENTLSEMGFPPCQTGVCTVTKQITWLSGKVSYGARLI